MPLEFQSTGNKELDKKIAEAHERREELLAANLCPNDCGGPLVRDSIEQRHCPDCGFTQVSSQLGLMPGRVLPFKVM